MPTIIDIENEKKSIPVKKIQESIPAGYIPITLSTNGRLGVPKIVHVKNFTTADLVNLSMVIEDILPENLITILQSLIWEKDVCVGDWPDKAVNEFVVKIYTNFFTPIITSIDFPVLPEDIAWLQEHGQSNKATDILSKKYSPKVDIDLRMVHIKDLDSSVKDHIKILKDKNTDHSLTIIYKTYPSIKDSITLTKYIENKYEESDKEFQDIKQASELRAELIQSGIYESLPHIDEKKFKEWQKYESNKILRTIQATQALYLEQFNDDDLRDKTLDEKIEYILAEPRIDASVAQKIEKQYAKIDFGLDPNIELKNPITGETCTRRFLFQYLDILQAIHKSDVDGYDISYVD